LPRINQIGAEFRTHRFTECGAAAPVSFPLAQNLESVAVLRRIMNVRVVATLLACELALIAGLIVVFPPKPNKPEFVHAGLGADDMRQVSALVRAAEWRYILSIRSWKSLYDLPRNLWYSHRWFICTFKSPYGDLPSVDGGFPLILTAMDDRRRCAHFVKYYVVKQQGRWRVGEGYNRYL
jgi:hypothetical protein